MIDQDDPLALTQAELIEVLYDWLGARSDEGRSKVRSRFKSLLKVNLPSGNRPQQGKREKYGFLQVCEIILCFELAQFGIDAWSVADQFRSDLGKWATILLKEVYLRQSHKPARKDCYLHFQMRLVDATPRIQVDERLIDKEELEIELACCGRACVMNFEMLAHVLWACLPEKAIHQLEIKQGSSPKPA